MFSGLVPILTTRQQNNKTTKQQNNNLPSFYSLPFTTYYIYTALESGCAFLRLGADALTSDGIYRGGGRRISLGTIKDMVHTRWQVGRVREEESN